MLYACSLVMIFNILNIRLIWSSPTNRLRETLSKHFHPSLWVPNVSALCLFPGCTDCNCHWVTQLALGLQPSWLQQQLVNHKKVVSDLIESWMIKKKDTLNPSEKKNWLKKYFCIILTTFSRKKLVINGEINSFETSQAATNKKDVEAVCSLSDVKAVPVSAKITDTQI